MLTFNGVGFFVSEAGYLLKEGIVISRDIVPQMSESMATAVTAASSVLQSGVIISIVAALLANLLMSGSLSSLLVAIHYLLITVHVTCTNCYFPGNVTAFFSVF